MFVRTISAVTLLFAASSAAAETRAIVFGNESYSHADAVAGAGAALTAAEALGEAGFNVIAGEDLRTPAMRDGLGDLMEADAPDRLVILLAGHFAQSVQATWFLGTEANRPSIATVDGMGLPISSLLGIAAATPGGAVVLLGSGPASPAALPLGAALSPGIGTFDVPQGVTVIRGDTADIIEFARDAMTTPDISLPELLADWPDLTAEGFLSRLIPFLPSEMLPDPASEAQAAAAAAAAERDYWDAVRETDTVEAYQTYLSRYPQGRFAGSARAAITRIEGNPERIEAELGLTASQRREVQRQLTLLDFNTRGIDGIFGPGTRTAITRWQDGRGLPSTGFLNATQLEQLAAEAARRQAEIAREEEERRLARDRADRAYWRSTGSGRDEAGLRTYIDRYPDGLFADVARIRLAEYQEIRDRRAWATASDTDTAEAYRRYLSDFPQGIFAQRARMRVDELTRAGETQRDRRAWDTARNTNTAEAYRRYLRDFPDGAFADAARARLAELDGARDRQAWQRVRAANTADAYRQYLSDFPEGIFADEARDRLNALTRDDNAEARAIEEALNLNQFTRQLIESQLQSLGFDPGRVDGQFDANTRGAIRRYQGSRGLPVTGYMTEQMVFRLIADGLPFPRN